MGLAVSALVTACGAAGATARADPSPAATMTMPLSPTDVPPEVPITPVATNTVKIENFAFSPAAITVTAGTTVTWTNLDIEQHTVTERDHSFDSDAISNGKSFAHRFDLPGRYHYRCLIHPNMTGLVIVTAT